MIVATLTRECFPLVQLLTDPASLTSLLWDDATTWAKGERFRRPEKARAGGIVSPGRSRLTAVGNLVKPKRLFSTGPLGEGVGFGTEEESYRYKVGPLRRCLGFWGMLGRVRGLGGGRCQPIARQFQFGRRTNALGQGISGWPVTVGVRSSSRNSRNSGSPHAAR